MDYKNHVVYISMDFWDILFCMYVNSDNYVLNPILRLNMLNKLGMGLKRRITWLWR